MSEYKRQAETCVTQIPECTPLAPAVANDPKDVVAPIIKNDKNGCLTFLVPKGSKRGLFGF